MQLVNGQISEERTLYNRVQLVHTQCDSCLVYDDSGLQMHTRTCMQPACFKPNVMTDWTVIAVKRKAFPVIPWQLDTVLNNPLGSASPIAITVVPSQWCEA